MEDKGVKKLEDITGREVSVGDLIAAGMRVGNCGTLRIGRVIETLTYEQNYPRELVAKMRVKWLEGYAGWNENKRPVLLTKACTFLILPPGYVEPEVLNGR